MMMMMMMMFSFLLLFAVSVLNFVSCMILLDSLFGREVDFQLGRIWACSAGSLESTLSPNSWKWKITLSERETHFGGTHFQLP